jgi:hypothetical protein
LVIRSVSDLDAPRFMIFDGNAHKLQLSAPYPDRDKRHRRADALHLLSGARRHPHSGVSRHAARRVHLPLAADRDAAWRAHCPRHLGYFFLRQFLLSRGYAVLQMNFRGSYGYGGGLAAHQDWGGLTYDDGRRHAGPFKRASRIRTRFASSAGAGG